MRRFVSAGLALSAITLALGTATVAHAQSVNTFEAPALAAGTFSYGTAGNAATFTNGSGISTANSAFTSGTTGNATQVAILQNAGTFSQTLTLTPGLYTFSFVAAQRANFGVGPQSFQVSLNGNSLGTFAPTGTTYQTFTTSAGNVTAGSILTFTGLTTLAGNGDRTAFVDNIVATNVAPEPGSIALLLPVMGAVGIVLRRRKK